jgi:hypothetical protein
VHEAAELLGRVALAAEVAHARGGRGRARTPRGGATSA